MSKRKEVLKAPEGYYFTKKGVLKKIDTGEPVGDVKLVEGEQKIISRTTGEIIESAILEKVEPLPQEIVREVVIGGQGIQIYLRDGVYRGTIWVSPMYRVVLYADSIEELIGKLEDAWRGGETARKEAEEPKPKEPEEKIEPEEEVVIGEPEVEDKLPDEPEHYEEDENVTETVTDETPDEEDVSTTEQEVYGELPVVEEEEPSVEPIIDEQKVVDEPVTEKPVIEEEKKPAEEDVKMMEIPSWLIPLAGLATFLALFLM